MGSVGPSDRRVPPSPSPQECVGFVAPRPPEGRCGLFDENSSDTCKAPRGARGFHQFAALQASNMEVRGEPRRRDSPRLPVNPSILLRKRGSPGRRPAGGGAHTAGLPRSFPQRRGEAFGTEPSRVWSCRRTLPVLNPESARNAANWRERRSGGPRAETGASRERDAVARNRLRLLGRALPEEEAAAQVSVRGIPKPQDYKNPFQSRHGRNRFNSSIIYRWSIIAQARGNSFLHKRDRNTWAQSCGWMMNILGIYCVEMC